VGHSFLLCDKTIVTFIMFLKAGEIQVIMDMIDAPAAGYDVTITPTDDRGNVGSSRILTVVITSRFLLHNILSKVHVRRLV